MNIQGSRLLLVGGAGLVGSHIADLLINEDVKEIVIYDNFVRGTRENLAHALNDPRVRVIEGDIRNLEHIEAAAKGMDGVFLLAALWLLQCAEDPRSGQEVNILGNLNVLEASRRAGVKRIVFSSSASVYGDAIVEPMPEEHPFNNRTFYGATKIALEQFLRTYYEMYRLDYVALRYFNIYGPRQDYRNAYVSVIMKVLDKIDSNQPPVIFGDGTQAYDFINVKDVARANIVAMNSNITDEVFNIATGAKTSINELVDLLLNITGSQLSPDYQPASQVFVSNRIGDPTKASKVLGFTSQTTLQDGLRDLVGWRANQIQVEPAV